ncbi:tape measure protein, partial [Shigella sonnei]
GILKAFEQMASKGKIQAEELRGQLGDRMAGAFQLFARSLGMTTEELDKAMKDGKVLSKDVFPKVSAEMGRMIDKAGGWEKI